MRGGEMNQIPSP